MLTKSRSYNEIRKRFNGNQSLSIAENSSDGAHQRMGPDQTKVKGENHKTVIYFGDSISHRKQHVQQDFYRGQGQQSASISRNLSNRSDDFQHARRLCEEMVFKRNCSIRYPKQKPNENRVNRGVFKESTLNDSKSSLATFQSDQNMVMKELKHIVEVKLKNQIKPPSAAPPPPPPMPISSAPTMVAEKPLVPQKKFSLLPHRTAPTIDYVQISDEKHSEPENDNDHFLPSFVESVVNGVINIKIDGSYNVATKLVESFGRDGNDNMSEYADNGSDTFLDVGGEINNVYFDWSFVQDWRAG